MDQQNTTIWQFILQAGSVAGLISLPYTILQFRKRRPQFKFDFRASSGTFIMKDNLEQYHLLFDGYVKNQSLEPNSITNICYAVWGNKSRTKTLSYGGQPVSITMNPNSSKTKLDLPISFKSKESKHFQVEFDLVLQGSHDKALVEALEKISPESEMYAPKYQYRLTFKDVNENLFDDQGRIKSQKLIDLWWLLPNTFNKLKEGNPLPYIFHMLKILYFYVLFKLRRLISIAGF